MSKDPLKVFGAHFGARYGSCNPFSYCNQKFFLNGISRSPGDNPKTVQKSCQQNTKNLLEIKMNTEPKAFPDLMIEQELIEYLRIPEISKSQNYKNVVEHLKAFRNLPRVHICNKVLYPLKAIQEWVNRETTSCR